MQQRSARRPLIGVTAGTREMMAGPWAGHEAVQLTAAHVRAVEAAGARAVILAPQDPWSEEELAELDGLVLTGGTDLDPALYGAQARPTDLASDPARDAFELELYRTARRLGLPVLGICRGMRLIVVAEGGALHQHLPDDLPAHPVTGERPTPVAVEIDAASDVALAVGTRAEVTAYHHQGALEPTGELRVVARHASGLPLAVEASRGALLLGLQWHPELDATGPGVFAALVAAVRERAAVSGGVRSGLG